MEEIIDKLRNLKLVNLKVREIYWVDITYINNPHDFYVRSNDYADYMHDLEQRGESITVDDLQLGALVIYKSKTLKRYVRGIIRNIVTVEGYANRRCSLFAVDYGCFDLTVSMKRIWKPLQNISIPPLAVNCKLFMCMPNGADWTKDSIDALKFYVGDKRAQIRVRGKEGEIYVVELFNASPDDLTTLMALTSYSNLGYPSKGSTDVNRFRAPKPEIQYFKHKPLEVGQKLQVRVQSGRSLDSFYVAQVDDYKKYKIFLNDFKYQCGRLNAPMFGDITVGCSYGVYLIGNNTYERGIVKKIMGNMQKMEVFLVDKGDTVVVPWEHLKQVKGQYFYEFYSIAVHCTADESQVWDNGLHRFLYPGFEFCITIKELGDVEKPNVVNISR